MSLELLDRQKSIPRVNWALVIEMLLERGNSYRKIGRYTLASGRLIKSLRLGEAKDCKHLVGRRLELYARNYLTDEEMQSAGFNPTN